MQNTACGITKVHSEVTGQLVGLIKGFMFK